MDTDLLAAIVSSSATALVAIVALIQNSRTVTRLEKHWDTRFDDLKDTLKSRFDSLDRQIEALDKRLSDLEHSRILR